MAIRKFKNNGSFVNAFGQWMPRAELSTITIQGKKHMAHMRRNHFARPRSKGGKTW